MLYKNPKESFKTAMLFGVLALSTLYAQTIWKLSQFKLWLVITSALLLGLSIDWILDRIFEKGEQKGEENGQTKE